MATRRKPSKMDTFSERGEHPTRTNPQVLKTVTSNVSFYKTLCRVIKMGSTPPLPVGEVKERAAKHMPFMSDHYTTVRPDVNTARHASKEKTDAIFSVVNTMVKYAPPYPSPKLTTRKQQEVLLAVEVIEKDMVLSPDYVASRIGQLKGDR